jgi:hypothetical protein
MTQDKYTVLPFDNQKMIIDLLNKQIDLKTFESWLLYNPELEAQVNESYLEAIGLNFNKVETIISIRKIFNEYLNYMEYERKKIKEITEELTLVNDNFPNLLKLIYNLSCRLDYAFLIPLSNATYSLTFEVGVYYMTDWKTKSDEDRKSIVENFMSLIREESANLMKKVEEGEIELTGRLSSEGNFFKE